MLLREFHAGVLILGCAILLATGAHAGDRTTFAQRQSIAGFCEQEAKTSAPRDAWLGKDKLQHFVVSAFLTTYTTFALKESWDVSKNNALVWGSSVTVTFGAGKELMDSKSKKGHASWKDFLADLLGIASAAVVIQIL